MSAYEGDVVRCCRCGKYWVGHEGERCTFCTRPARVAWGRVILTLAAVALIVLAVSL